MTRDPIVSCEVTELLGNHYTSWSRVVQGSNSVDQEDMKYLVAYVIIFMLEAFAVLAQSSTQG